MPPARSHFLATPRARALLDRDYTPSAFIPSLSAVVADWAARTAAGVPPQALSYGPGPRQAIDLYRAARPGGPLLVFVHGGFWQALSRAESGFVAPGWTAAGVDVAVLDYDLAPEATLPQIVGQVTRALCWLAEAAPALGLDARRMVVAGHSAGAHLAAMAVLAPRPPPVAGLALVSGVFDLAPVAACYVNDVVRMTEAEAAGLSPALRLPPAPLPVLVTVGEDEPLGFHEQSRALAWAWRGHGCADGLLLLPGLNHFSILDALGDPASALGRAVARML